VLKIYYKTVLQLKFVPGTLQRPRMSYVYVFIEIKKKLLNQVSKKKVLASKSGYALYLFFI